MSEEFAVDRAAYPFTSRYFDVEGGRMHYVDEGTGPPIVMVHGTPVWSFVYRHLIRELRGTNRVIAPDLLGFGLSNKPDGADYRPAAQAARLASLLDSLELDDATVVVNDFGGPIGLSWAIQNPERVGRLVLFNTWMWSLAGTPAERLSRMLSGRLGRFLYKRLNVSPKVLLKTMYGDRAKLSPEVHRQYTGVFPTPAERHAPWVYARELLRSGPWYDQLWSRLDAIADHPALLLWGMKDPAFRPEALARWQGALRNARTVEFADAGHFVQEEAPERAVEEIRELLSLRPSTHSSGEGMDSGDP